MPKEKRTEGVRCSFCGRFSDFSNGKFVAGPDKIVICDECVKVCIDAIWGDDIQSIFNKMQRTAFGEMWGF